MVGVEIQIGEIPIPLVNYIYLIRDRKSPYFEIAKYIIKEMEFHYKDAQKDGRSEIVYTVNPRVLVDEMGALVREENKAKLTTVNVCRTVRALAALCKLKEENFYTTTTSGGRPNYHFKVNQKTLNSFARIL